MSDLIKRLRKAYGVIDKFEIAQEAADYIQKLKAALNLQITDTALAEVKLEEATDRIHELQAEKKHWIDEATKHTKTCLKLEAEIRELQVQIGELKTENGKLKDKLSASVLF